MKLYPAIDLIGGEAVRLYKGDYEKKTVYSRDPLSVAQGFREAGAEYLHLVDLEGAKSGGTPNFDVIRRIIDGSGLKAEIGGGIRSEETVRAYLDAGADRVILGTAAVEDPTFLRTMVDTYGERIAVGVDIRDEEVATHGWTVSSGKGCLEFCQMLQDIGVHSVICTDISKDGVLGGTNMALYRQLCRDFTMEFTASGGVSTLADVEQLRSMGLSAAILGKALYTGMLDLSAAVALCKEEQP